MLSFWITRALKKVQRLNCTLNASNTDVAQLTDICSEHFFSHHYPFYKEISEENVKLLPLHHVTDFSHLRKVHFYTGLTNSINLKRKLPPFCAQTRAEHSSRAGSRFLGWGLISHHNCKFWGKSIKFALWKLWLLSFHASDNTAS